jgi:hypothetical protein
MTVRGGGRCGPGCGFRLACNHLLSFENGGRVLEAGRGELLTGKAEDKLVPWSVSGFRGQEGFGPRPDSARSVVSEKMESWCMPAMLWSGPMRWLAPGN